MADKFEKFPSNIESPAERAFVVVPNDATDLAVSTRALYVGGSGDVAVILVGDSVAVTFSNLVTGTILPIRVKRVLVTGTTATNIVGIY